mgnify:CR=1 FL=1
MRNYFELNEVSIFYNIYTKVSDRSIKNSIISSIGGKFVNKKKQNYINALKNILFLSLSSTTKLLTEILSGYVYKR